MARRAVISVSDKSGVVDFARRVQAAGFEIVSTGGTFRTITEAGVQATYVTEVTGHPEVFGGRVKTLHPMVHGGILFRRDLEDHRREAESHNIEPVDLVVVNLYPFRETVQKPGVTIEDAIENIDIGGPTMIRAAAKNNAAVTVVCDPADYDAVATALETAGATSPEQRRALALKAFRHTASYDVAIAQYLSRAAAEAPSQVAQLDVTSTHVQSLRYGENPHQDASLFSISGQPLEGATLLQGKALSYNNLVDLDAAWAACTEFDDPAVVVVKHTNPCGVGRHDTSLVDAYTRALAGDPVSAFGGIVAANQSIDGALAALLAERFLEVVVAPSFSDEAKAILGKKKNLRLIETETLLPASPIVPRWTRFGLLAQSADPAIRSMPQDWTVPTDRKPTDHESTAAAFLWRVCKHVKSNAIVIGNHERTFGVGAGQMSRVDAVRLAVQKATADLAGSVLASDAFFPFRDGVDEAAAAGVRVIIQPGGSKRDDEVIEAANEHGIAMIFTGHRHFRH